MNDPVELQRRQLLAWLARRGASTPVTRVETHISIVAFQGDRVYKLKKSVHYPFIDLSTAARRLTDCEREVTLNRRLAPDVYLGVEAVTDADAALVDHVVVMRRMPDELRLASLAAHGDAADVCVERIGELIARFHTEAPTGDAIDDAATRDAALELWEQGVSQCAPFVGGVFAPEVANRVALRARRYLAGRLPLFAARLAGGHARDGHGDLLADDIFCLPDGPRVLDCLEFDDRLRFGDVLGDVAFLAMDLEHLGRVDLARRFLDRYRTVTHDEWPRSLEHLYIAYRAHVRAKVTAIRGDRDEDAQRLLSLSCAHLDAGRVRLVLVGGSPATGKTTIAGALAHATGWALLRSDEVRKELAGMAPTARARAALDQGLYDATWTRRTYAVLCDRARMFLGLGHSVVLDASWSDPAWRRAAAELADESVADLVELRCDAPVGVAQARAARRAALGTDASDVTPELVAALAARFPVWAQAATVSTAGPVPEVMSEVLTRVGTF